MPKYIYIFLNISLFISIQTNSQVLLRILALPEKTPDSAQIFVAGTFNGWNPGHAAYQLKKSENGFLEISLQIEAGQIEYKFTLGAWEKEECTNDGQTIPNRKSDVKPGDTIFVAIQAWKIGKREHTRSLNVHVLKEDFYMPQLHRKRRIWIYLPPDYQISKNRYPVFYAHDGQNLFDHATSFSGEWAVDESLDSLFALKLKSCIIVGIDNGGQFRLEELTPWMHPTYGGGNAKPYADFIVKTLKPYIDSSFRTIPDRKYTGVFGSSLGGLVSFYMALNYPEIFGMAGVFSPSFWFSDEVYALANQFKHRKKPKIYMVSGRKESATLETEVLRMEKILRNKGFGNKQLVVKIASNGQHHEWFWRREFPKVYNWLVGN
jgi:predicted alpha/beta superfamily hydrolase